jgi:DNA topoisomerase IB
VAEVAARLPKARTSILEHISLDGMPVERAAATAVRLLDLGYFRIGSDAYADANGSFGLTTLEKRHVRRRKDRLLFEFTGKSGIEHVIEIDDALAVDAVETMRRRRGGGDRLLAFKDVRVWTPMDAAMVNDYLRESTGAEITAKDFRTWHATVLAAAALAASDEPGDTKASRKRAVAGALREVATYLGNTPAVARSSYVDPRVVDLYEDGVTVAAAVRRSYDSPDEQQRAIERAVSRMLDSAPQQLGRAARKRD